MQLLKKKQDIVSHTIFLHVLNWAYVSAIDKL